MEWLANHRLDAKAAQERNLESVACLRRPPAVILGIMSATLRLPLDPEILAMAEHEAHARHTTLPEVVARQLRVMARNWQDSREGKTPLTDGLRGAVQLPHDFDQRAAITEELRKKHGRLWK
jgi:hypothetical protein